MEQVERKRTIFFSDASYNSVPTMETDTFYLGVTDMEEDEIAYHSVQSIVKFEESYEVTTPQGRKAFEMLKKTLVPDSTVDNYIEALDNFAKNFMNNPYMYESGLFYLCDADKIRAANSAFYLVKVGRVVVPIGLLKEIISEETAKIIIRSFFDKKNSEFNVVLQNNKEASMQFSPTTEKDLNIAKKLKFRKRLSIVLIILSAWFAIEKLILGVQWQKIPEVIRSGADFIPCVGFLTEKSYGINHNSVLCLIILFVSVLWLITFLRLVSPFSKEHKSYKIYKIRAEISTRCKNINLNLHNLIEDNDTRLYFILENLNVLDNIDFDCGSKAVAENMIYINNAAKIQSVSTPKTFLPNTGKLVFMLLLVVFSFYSVSDLNVINAENVVDEAYCTVAKLVDGIKFKMVKKYTANDVIPVYTKSDNVDFVVYEMQPGESFEIVDYNYSDDYIFGIRILTRYGFVNGWINNSDFSYYSPSVSKLTVASASATSEGYYSTANKAIDSKASTAWCENVDGYGENEYIDIYLEQVSPIDVVMIQIGNNSSKGTFEKNSRPHILSVEFFKDGQFLKNAYVVLSDVSRAQYFQLNKSIEADKVRFVIDTVTEGENYKDTYISELALFCTEQIEQVVQE